MADTGFTSQEQIGGVQGSVQLLWRYVCSLPVLRHLFVPSILCSLVGTAGYQAFVWLAGLLAACQGDLACTAAVPGGAWRLPLSGGGLFVLAVIFVAVRTFGWILFEVGGQWGAVVLHAAMVRGVGRVRTTFFDEFPSGRLINRLVRDFDSLRIMAPIRIGDTLNALIELGVITAFICIAQPLAGLAVIPTLAAFYYVQRNVAPMLQRCLTLRSVRFGEVLHRETDVIEGIRTYLLYNVEDALFSRLRSAVRRFAGAHLLRFYIEGWGRFWSQSASSLYAFLALLSVAWGVKTGRISEVIGTVIITAVFRLGGTFGWLIWASGLLFESAGHARRVFEYVDLPPEESEEGRPSPGAPPTSPDPGAVQFNSFSMSYRKDTPVILSDLSLQIAGASKVGIIGRTGAGKTSIMQSLFRMVYVHGGDILVGGRSIFSMSIDEARALLGVVPQDPYLFEGTVRSNLDRYREFPDERLADALSAVRLPLELHEVIHEGGKNLSVGQRQLLCLTRAMLSGRAIIMMDEPTSGVDAITDAIIQRTLRTALADRTVITIAHRLETLARMDRVIELADGRLIRDGTPQEIMAQISEEELA